MTRSEVEQLRQQIATEYMAAKLGLQGLNAGTSRHEFITARQERIGTLHEELQDLVGDEAIALVAETFDGLPDAATRSDVLTVFRYELGNSEETEHLCDHLQEMWKTIDMLRDRFGVEQAQKIMLAPFSSLVRETPPS
jgi:hypothetical protein